ncbi:endocuticle structural glycoprotein SgAbd-5-like [Toxorhynchites rutilus septentrionalis]|uniref:endocuticle structural glycoprotein SgAbd-5-like n=1 Tax=Toxorhynchites rutilus septentrionalis TaxID=329112 RepID=UPI0024785968|nr:endocuticle structural glycoprotein SgAbd-5-like [Toxorhynchites rutilus septentrionalis]
MKLLAVFAFVLLSCHLTAAQDEVQIVQFTNENNVDGSYNFAYEQSDGQKREESGVLKPVEGAEVPAIAVSGSYEFTDPNGQRYRVDYTADERGYRPTVTKL